MIADVLIVEDDVALAHAIAATLRRHNITSDHVESSEDAISAVTARRYSVVILDIILREFKSGYYVVDAIRQLPAARRPYVIVTTGAPMNAIANLDKAIVNAIFIKPLQLDILAKAVHTVKLRDDANSARGDTADNRAPDAR